ncbi:hypothetical protein BOX15_Mlig016099g2, partial [Macrostomum lignano]
LKAVSMPDNGYENGSLESSSIVMLTRQRRSNRIASQPQQHQHLQEEELTQAAQPDATKNEPQHQKQRRRKQGRPSSSAAQAPAAESDTIITNHPDSQLSASNLLICFDCRFATLQLSAYMDHVMQRHGLAPTEVKLHRCLDCGFLSSEAAVLTEHVTVMGHGAAATASDNPEPACPDDNLAISTGTAVGHVTPKSRGPHSCTSCGKHFRLRYSLMRHRLAVHQSESAAATPAADTEATSSASKLACRICCKLFKSQRSYQVHRLAFHASNTDDATAAGKAAIADQSLINLDCPTNPGDDCVIVSDPEPFKCRYCDLKFAKKTAFARHVAVDHPAERPYQCGQCGRGFKFPHSLAMHARFHKGELTCEQCGRLFHSDREFHEHMASVHEGSLTFLCESCGRTFPTQYRLNRHARSHNRDRQLDCPQCGRLFHRADKLKLHLECVHSDRRPHLCHLCGRAYNRRDKLALHIKQHQRKEEQQQQKQQQQQEQQQKQSKPCKVGRRPRKKATVATEGPRTEEPTPTPTPPTQPHVPPPPSSLPTTHCPNSPLGDALISIANGCLHDDVISDGFLLQQQQQQQQQHQQQIIFLESFDQPEQQHLALYSPLSGAFFAANDGNLMQ